MTNANDCTHMKYSEQLNSERPKIEWQLPGAEGKDKQGVRFNGYRASVLQSEKFSVNGS